MGTHEIRRRVISAISRHAGAMSREQIDKALETWDRAVKRDLTKSGNMTIDTTAADKRREERKREEAKLSTKGDDKETGRSFEIGYGNGRSLSYQIGNDGELIVTPDKPGIYTPKDYKAMLEAITRDIEKRGDIMEKSKKTGTRWSRAPMLLKKPTTTTTKRWEQPQPKAKAQTPRVAAKTPEQPQAPAQVSQPQPVPPARERNPLVDQFSLIQGKIDLRNLTGHQMAAIKAGLDPNTPGIEKMGLQEMKSIAAQQVLETVKDLQERTRIAYTRDPRPFRF